MTAKLLILVSGKRKSGKDFVAERLRARLVAAGAPAAVVRISAPLKREYARLHALELDRLLSADAYKERHRLDMVRWGEARRAQDAGCFCRAALADAPTDAAVVVVSDVRRRSDLAYFGALPVRRLLVRVHCDEATRARRGWTFDAAVDAAPTECDLDGVDEWDARLRNAGDDGAALDADLGALVGRATEMLASLS